MENKWTNIFNKLKIILKRYALLISFVLLTIFYELLGVAVTFHKFYIRDPRILFIYLSLASVLICLLPKQKIRYICCSILLAITGIVNLLFIVVYKMTGTIFDFGMLNLRKDAMGIIESLPIPFLFTFLFGLSFSLYLVFGKKYLNYLPEIKITKLKTAINLFLIIILIITNVIVVISLNNVTTKASEVERLYEKDELGYTELGITSTVINEFYKGLFFNNVDMGDEQEIADFLYQDDHIYYGSKEANPNNIDRSNYNVITILAESLEWFSFIEDLDKYPNGYNLEDPTVLESPNLYKNLYDFYNRSIVMNQFYAREKTDISENLSIIGNYPTDAYINYDFPYNTNPFTLPNVLKSLDDDILCKSYHNGLRGYYNRNICHLSLGFEEFVDTVTMESKFNMKNYIPTGERNLDSEMISSCKEEMFPLDRRFYTYITSITMHGQYTFRNNLDNKGYYDYLDSIGVKEQFGKGKDDENKNIFRNYCAAALEFDRAIGKLWEILEETGLSKNTIVVIFGDHNAYYQGLSNYVKQIYDTNDHHYTELFRIPLMIYVPDMPHQVIDKFCYTADIVPTLFDLLGINFYENMYFGHSIFSDEESILYSRAYNVFITNHIFFPNLNKILYLEDGYDKEYLNDIENRAVKIMTKLGYINRIFYNDYFGIKSLDNNDNPIKKNEIIFYEHLKAINNGEDL